MRPFARVLTFLFMLSLLLSAGCGPRNSEVVTNPSDGENTTESSFTTMEALGYQPKSEQVCAFVINNYYHQKDNVCVVASDSCEGQFATKMRFVKDSFGICPSEDNQKGKEESVEEEIDWQEPEDLGYEEIGLCTAEYKVMYNPDSGQCMKATNGCQISYAESEGYEPDFSGQCL
ncbi:MAG: hypothetical protein AAF203_00060 [Pseudomonadota bacterium]